MRNPCLLGPRDYQLQGRLRRILKRYLELGCGPLHCPGGEGPVQREQHERVEPEHPNWDVEFHGDQGCWVIERMHRFDQENARREPEAENHTLGNNRARVGQE